MAPEHLVSVLRLWLAREGACVPEGRPRGAQGRAAGSVPCGACRACRAAVAAWPAMTQTGLSLFPKLGARVSRSSDRQATSLRRVPRHYSPLRGLGARLKARSLSASQGAGPLRPL